MDDDRAAPLEPRPPRSAFGGPPPRPGAPVSSPPPAPPRPRAPGIGDRVKGAPITFAILAINALVFLWAEKSGDTETTGTLIRFGAIEPVHVWIGQYWRLLTYSFLHIGWMHFLWNSYAAVDWSTAVERALGKGRFVFVYLVAGIGGGAASVIFSPSVSAGASGAMFGIVGATLALRRRQLPSFAAFFQDRGTRATVLSIAIWTAIGFTALRMNHWAHFGGLACGALATWLVTARAGARRAAMGAAFAAGFAVLLACAARPWWRPTGEWAKWVTAWAEIYRVGSDDVAADPALSARIAERGCRAGVADACAVLGELRAAPVRARPK